MGSGLRFWQLDPRAEQLTLFIYSSSMDRLISRHYAGITVTIIMIMGIPLYFIKSSTGGRRLSRLRGKSKHMKLTKTLDNFSSRHLTLLHLVRRQNRPSRFPHTVYTQCQRYDRVNSVPLSQTVAVQVAFTSKKVGMLARNICKSKVRGCNRTLYPWATSATELKHQTWVEHVTIRSLDEQVDSFVHVKVFIARINWSRK